MKLSELRGDRALDALAEILEPGQNIVGDKEFADAIREGKRLAAAKIALKKHKSDVRAILAALDGVAPEEWNGGILAPIARVLEILNDPEVIELFSFGSQIAEQSGSRSENTEA